MNDYQVRAANQHDLGAIREIYNHEVRTGTGTFDREPVDAPAMLAWFMRRGSRHPVVVATDANGVVGGYAAVGTYIARPAAERSGEVAVYVHGDHRGRGLGLQLLDAVVTSARDAGLHLLVSRIVADNQASIRIHERAGFVRVGLIPEAGRKFDQWLDLAIYYKRLGERD